MPSRLTTVVSIGTGRFVDARGGVSRGPVEALMGLGLWSLADRAEAGQSLWRSTALESDATAESFEAVHAPHFQTYLRLQPPLTTWLDLDETNLATIEAARAETRAWMESASGSAKLQEAADALRAQAGPAMLSLDGGGMGGFVQLEVVKELTRRVGKPLTDVTFLICGTSIGGAAVTVLALGGARVRS